MRTALTRNRTRQHFRPELSFPGTVRINIVLASPCHAISLGQCELTKTAWILELVRHQFWAGCRQHPFLGSAVLLWQVHPPPDTLELEDGKVLKCHTFCHLPDSELYKKKKKSTLIWSLIWRMSRIYKYCQLNTQTRVTRALHSL